MNPYEFAGAHGSAPFARPPNVDVSVVVPVYNERNCIAPLIERLTAALSASATSFEIILVDDGSRDGTWEAVLAAHAENERVDGLRLIRNFGQQNALLAGLYYSAGQAVITMDGDLQHPPEAIPEMIALWRDGHKVVNTRREDSDSASGMKRAGSRHFYRIFSWLANVTIDEGSSDFRLLDRAVVERLLQFRGGHDFLRGAVNWFGYPGATVTFRAAVRHAGLGKYTLCSLMRFAIDGIVSFSTKPLHLGIWLGMVLSILSFFELAYALIVWSSGSVVPGWASLMIVMTFLFGFLFLLIGILGIYISHIHRALQAPPRFVVAESAGDNRKAPSTKPDIDFKTVPDC